jgi:hypothetical protein
MGAPLHFVKELGMQHVSHSVQSGTPNAFMTTPFLRLHKSMWDELQDINLETLACSFILARNGKNLESKFAARVLEILEQCYEGEQDRSVAPEQQGQPGGARLSSHGRHQYCPDVTTTSPE